jgi:hypothetical protein
MLKSRFEIGGVPTHEAPAGHPLNSKLRRTALLVLGVCLALGSAHAQTQWTDEFGDNKGWDHPEYATTIMFGDINGDGKLDVCGRGVAGIYCSLSNGSGFDTAIWALYDFTDQEGWNNPAYYSTLRMADVNGDGRADVCGRGIYGIWCAISKGDGTFNAVQQWTTDYSDSQGWGFLQYGGTLMFGDLNGDGKADVCARSYIGLDCALSTGTGFSPYFNAGRDFDDAGGWYNSIYYTSLRLADVNGDGFADACGRGVYGITCALSKGDGTFNTGILMTPDFKDSPQWDLIQYASTMMFADINGDGKADVCGRGVLGVYCAISTGTSFRDAPLATTDFSDESGWNNITWYGSIRLADVNGDKQADICGREADGIHCATASIAFK